MKAYGQSRTFASEGHPVRVGLCRPVVKLRTAGRSRKIQGFSPKILLPGPQLYGYTHQLHFHQIFFKKRQKNT
jgi:hypothetical protein